MRRIKPLEWLVGVLVMAGLGLFQIYFGFAIGAFATGVGLGIAIAGFLLSHYLFTPNTGL